MQTISACLIVKNAEDTLAKALEAALPWVDEIIVVDTGSTDKTKEIVRKYTPHLYDFPWCDDFSAARNYSLEKATGSWILWLDADDLLSEDTGQRLRPIVASVSSKVAFFSFQYQSGPMPDRIRRFSLFRNHPLIKFKGRVHEQICNMEDLPSPDNFQIVETTLAITHISSEKAASKRDKKLQYYLSIMQEEVNENPDYPPLLFHIGIASYHAGSFKESCEFLERFLAAANPYDDLRKGKSYALLIEMRAQLGANQLAEEVIDRALAEMGRYPDVLYNSAGYYLEKGNRDRAIDLYTRLAQVPYEAVPDFSDRELVYTQRFLRLAELNLEDKKPQVAEDLCIIALKNQPGNLAALILLGQAYQAQGKDEVLKDYLAKAQLQAPDVAKRIQEAL